MTAKADDEERDRTPGSRVWFKRRLHLALSTACGSGVMGRSARAVAIVARFGKRLGSCEDAVTVIGIWPRNLLSYAERS